MELCQVRVGLSLRKDSSPGTVDFEQAPHSPKPARVREGFEFSLVLSGIWNRV